MKAKNLVLIYLITIISVWGLFYKHFEAESYGKHEFHKDFGEHPILESIQLRHLPYGILIDSSGRYAYVTLPAIARVLKIDLDSKMITSNFQMPDDYYLGITTDRSNDYLYIARPYTDEVLIRSISSFCSFEYPKKS